MLSVRTTCWCWLPSQGTGLRAGRLTSHSCETMAPRSFLEHLRLLVIYGFPTPRGGEQGANCFPFISGPPWALSSHTRHTAGSSLRSTATPCGFSPEDSGVTQTGCWQRGASTALFLTSLPLFCLSTPKNSFKCPCDSTPQPVFQKQISGAICIHISIGVREGKPGWLLRAGEPAGSERLSDKNQLLRKFLLMRSYSTLSCTAQSDFPILRPMSL